MRVILILLLAAQFMLAADFSILNVALPDIGRGLGFSLGSLQWITTSFALAAAGFTLLFGRIADLFGRRRMFLLGIGLLTAASLVGGFAVSPAMLLVGRTAQGVATAVVTPAALSLLTTSFPQGPLRDRALGLNGAMLSAGFITGAILGGVLTDLLSWRWAFFINVPVGLFVLIAAVFAVRESRAERTGRLDVPGAVTVSGGLLLVVFGISSAEPDGWLSAVTLGSLAAGIVALVGFWFIETRTKYPLVSLGVLRLRNVRWGNFGGIITFTMGSGITFLMTLYLQRVLGYSPLVTGLSFGLLGAAAFVGGMTAPRLIGRLGAPQSLVVGLVVQAAASGMLVGLGGGTRSWLILVLAGTAVAGFGHITSVVCFMVNATTGLPDNQQGVATGMATLTQQVGLALGIPVLSAIATVRASALQAAHASAADAVLGGVRLALIVNGAVVLAGAVLIALFFVGRLAPPPDLIEEEEMAEVRASADGLSG